MIFPCPQNELAAAQEELASSYMEVEHLQEELRSTNATGGCGAGCKGGKRGCGVTQDWGYPPQPRLCLRMCTLSSRTRFPLGCSSHSHPPSLSLCCAVKSLFADVHSIKNKVFQERQERAAAAAAAPSVPSVLQSLDQATREFAGPQCRAGMHAGGWLHAAWGSTPSASCLLTEPSSD